MLDSLLCWLVKALGWLLCRLPPSACVRIGQVLGQVWAWLSPKRVRIGTQNLKAAFGERQTPTQRRRIIHATFRNLGAGLLEMLRLPVMDAAYLERYIDMAPPGAFESVVALERPVIWLTGHFGNWELSSIGSALRGHPIVAVARAQDNLPKLYQLLVSYRESKGCKIIHKGGAMRQLLQALQEGRTLGIVGDQATSQGIWVEFFGRPALFAIGPFKLAQAANALIVPECIFRLRGPHHRIVIGPVIDMAQLPGTPEEAVRAGVEQFANRLAEHITAAPEQWLWMHKRWKRTPQRRAVVLSDGKLGHVKQSLTVVQALRERQPELRHQVIEVRYRNAAARTLALAWAWLAPKGWGAPACLRWTLAPDCFRQAAGAYADIVISTGAAAAPVNVLMAAENRAKSIVIMDPAPLPLWRFDLAFVPMHDQVAPRANVVQTLGALQPSSNGDATLAKEALRQHPKFRADCRVPEARPHITVLIGGDTPEHQVTGSFVEALLRQVLALCEETDAACLVTTSRRTAPEAERIAAQYLDRHPRCRALILAGRDPLEGTMAGLLAWASVIVVTGDSVSMVSEACTSGQPVIIVEPALRRSQLEGGPKVSRFVQTLVQQGYARRYLLPEVGLAIRRAVAEHRPTPRLDTYAIVKDAVSKVL